MAIPKIPEQCRSCAQWSMEDQICNVYEFLPGEGDRAQVTDCPSYYSKDQETELKLLAQYIDEDPDHLVEQQLSKIVSNIIDGYEEKFKIMVVGVARRKIKAMIRMVDIIDILLEKLSDRQTLDEMNSSQTLRLLSELNSSINTDLTFIMKLVNPDTKLHDLQMWVDARSVIQVNGASPETEMKSEEILSLTSVSRDKIRDAFDALLNNIPNEEEELSEEHVLTEDDEEELNNL